MAKPIVSFKVLVENPSSHLFRVQCYITCPHDHFQFSLPAWIPGSYLIREFAKNITSMSAYCNNKPVAVNKMNKNTWLCPTSKGDLLLEYTVYAFDPSIRSAFLNSDYGFFNGTSLFVRPHGLEDTNFEVHIKTDWPISTSMPSICHSYEEFVDHPVYIGPCDTINFDVDSIAHKLVVIGKHDGDLSRMATDLQKLCHTHIQFFDGRAPFKHYTFLLRVEEDAYGGLEHQSSSALLCKRSDLPRSHHKQISDSYKTLLGLFSHEYFHAWNVKSMRPQTLLSYNFDQENYTDLLWFFEGFTSYYDDLMLRRSGLISSESYLELLSKTMTRVWQGKGRQHQTLEEASYDAWIKFYRPDENSPNAHVSYYTKGSLVALALDLKIRLATSHQHSLDDVMKRLWSNYKGKPIAVNKHQIIQLSEEVVGASLEDFFEQALQSTQDFDLISLFKTFGATCTFQPSDNWGVKIKSDAYNETRIAFVERDSVAEKSGLAPGDTLVAWNGFKITTQNLSTLVARSAPSETVTLHAFRDGVLFQTQITLDKPQLDICHLSITQRLPSPWE